MWKHQIQVLTTALVLACGAGCSEESDSTPTAGDDQPDDSKPDASTDDVVDSTPVNPNCPNAAPPATGVGAEKGACCYRGNSNSARLAQAEDGVFDLGYRINFAFPSNHPSSLSLNGLRALALSRHQNQEQSLLIRLSVPVRDGELQAGEGELTLGQGRYNCDGTYSFYGDGAAPVREGFPNSDNADRWKATTVKATFDPETSDGAAFSVAYADEDQDRSYSPFMVADGSKLKLDWEIVTQRFSISEWAWDDLDCLGDFDTRTNDWRTKGEYIFYAALDENMAGNNGIDALGDIHLSQLIAFGLAGGNATQALDPQQEPRCTPGSSEECPWIKLPDSLCPATEEEAALFRCHVGDQNDPKETARCSTTAPATPRDGDSEDEGQCCDPLGESDTLPACNAYLVRNPFVAASAEITEAQSSEMFTGCQ